MAEFAGDQSRLKARRRLAYHRGAFACTCLPTLVCECLHYLKLTRFAAPLSRLYHPAARLHLLASTLAPPASLLCPRFLFLRPHLLPAGHPVCLKQILL